MDGLAPQPPHYFRDVVLLEKADCGDAGGARIKTGACILECDPAQGKDGDLLPASFAQSIETRRAGWRGVLLFEDWGEDGEVSPLDGGASNISR
jgi:hypothetical protein